MIGRVSEATSDRRCRAWCGTVRYSYKHVYDTYHVKLRSARYHISQIQASLLYGNMATPSVPLSVRIIIKSIVGVYTDAFVIIYP